MKKNAAVLLTVFIACLLVSFAGCSQDTHAGTGDNPWVSTDIYSLQGTHSDKGYYYIQDESILCFFDEATRKNVILCSKTGCSHSDANCYAYTTADPAFLFFSNGKLYSIEVGKDGYQLIQRDEDGSNREVKRTLMEDAGEQNASASIADYKACEKYLYYLGRIITQDNNGQSVETSTLRRVSLDTFQEEELYNSGNKGCSIVSVNNGQVIFNEFDAPEQTADNEEYDPDTYRSEEFLRKNTIKIQMWDEKDCSVKTLLDSDRWETLGGISAYGNFMYYLDWDEEHKNNGLQQFNLQSGEISQIIGKEAPIGNFCPLDPEKLLLMDGSNFQWKLYEQKDFKEIGLPFLEEGDLIVQGTKEGYIVLRILEETEDGLIKKQAYSYISKENAEQGVRNFTDFYIATY